MINKKNYSSLFPNIIFSSWFAIFWIFLLFLYNLPPIIFFLALLFLSLLFSSFLSLVLSWGIDGFSINLLFSFKSLLLFWFTFVSLLLLLLFLKVYSLKFLINFSFLLRFKPSSCLGDKVKILLLLLSKTLWDKFASGGFCFWKILKILLDY